MHTARRDFPVSCVDLIGKLENVRWIGSGGNMHPAQIIIYYYNRATTEIIVIIPSLLSRGNNISTVVGAFVGARIYIYFYIIM